MKHFFISIGRIISYIFPIELLSYCNRVKNCIYTGFHYRKFKYISVNARLSVGMEIIGAKYISIGSHSQLGVGILTAYSRYKCEGKLIIPEIIIGDNCSIGHRFHITAVNKIIIGNNVLVGPNVLITDNSHGASDRTSLTIPPIKRPILSKGPVYIEDNVWIGESVTILPNVAIGKGVVIAANSVVTKDVPPFCIVAGNPAQVIKQL